MQLEFLCSLKLPSLVKQRLGVLPPNLHKIYEENYSQKLGSYQEEERRIVESAFRFLLCAQERLNTSGLLEALSALDPETPPLSPDLLLALCFNFIDVDYQLDVFRFAHLSVREYIESKSNYEWTSNHALAAECCVRFLSSGEVVKRYEVVGRVTEDVSNSEDTSSVRTAYEMVADSKVTGVVRPKLLESTNTDTALLELTNFHRYACLHWAFHLARSGDVRLASPLKDLLYAFVMDDQHATSKAYSVWSMDLRYRWINWLRPTTELAAELHSALGTYVKFPATDYLFAACVWGFDDLLEIRIRAALNPANGQIIHDNGRALYTATKFGNYTAVRLLLEHGADLKYRDTVHQMTALCHSVVHRSRQICQALLERGADPTTPDIQGKTPLSWAVGNSDLDMTKMLLSYRANSDVEDTLYKNRPLQTAIFFGALEIAQVLLAYGADPDRGYNDPPLYEAVARGDVEVVRMLLTYGANPTIRLSGSFWYPYWSGLLEQTIRSGWLDITRLLLEHGADPNETRPLQQAIQTGRLDIATLLLDRGADPNADHNWYRSPVWFAASEGNLEMLKMLFDCGARAPTTCMDSEGNTYPLSRVQECFSADIVKLLQQHGCTFEDELELEKKDQGLDSLHLCWLELRKDVQGRCQLEDKRLEDSELDRSPLLVGGWS